MALLSDICRDKKESEHITYQDIADKANISASTVTNFLSHGSKAPSVYTVGPICAALGISLDQYFGIETEKEETEDQTEKLYEEINSREKEIESLKWRIVTYKMFLKIACVFIFLLIIACGVLAVCQPIKLA